MSSKPLDPGKLSAEALDKKIAEKIQGYKQGIKIDLGCGQNKQKNFFGIDKIGFDNVDLVWDLENIPYPLPDKCASVLMASHIVEHLKPWLFIEIMDEWWRLLKPQGQLMIAVPYGVGSGFIQDPTHCNPCNEHTWAYFDPLHESNLWHIYKPQPWAINLNTWRVNGNMEVVLEKRLVDRTYETGNKGSKHQG